MRVFNDTDLFWREIRHKRSAPAPENQPAGAGALVVDTVDSGQEVPASEQAKRQAPVAKGGRPRLTVNERMKAVFDQNYEARSWTISQWQEHLGGSRAAIHATETWQTLAAAHKLAKAEAALSKQPDRRRRPKHH